MTEAKDWGSAPAFAEAMSLLYELMGMEDAQARPGAAFSGQSPEERKHHGRLQERLYEISEAITTTRRDYILLQGLQTAMDMYEEEGDPEASRRVADELARAQSTLKESAQQQTGRDKREASAAFGQPGAMERLKAFYANDPRARGKRGYPTREKMGELMGVSAPTAKKYLEDECVVSVYAANRLRLSIGQRDYERIIPSDDTADMLRELCVRQLREITNKPALGVVLIMLEGLAKNEKDLTD